MADLRGVGRLLAASRSSASADRRGQHAGLRAPLPGLRGTLGAGGANAVALTVTAVANTAANRRFTFGVRERHGLIRDHAGGFAVFVLTLALTSAALAVLRGLDPDPSPAVELAVLVTASACATVTRYVALRSWVFRRHRRPAETALGRWGQAARTATGAETEATASSSAVSNPASASAER